MAETDPTAPYPHRLTIILSVIGIAIAIAFGAIGLLKSPSPHGGQGGPGGGATSMFGPAQGGPAGAPAIAELAGLAVMRIQIMDRRTAARAETPGRRITRRAAAASLGKSSAIRIVSWTMGLGCGIAETAGILERPA